MALKQMRHSKHLLSLKRYKQFVNRVHFNLKEHVRILLRHPLKVLKWACAPPPPLASMPVLKQYRSLIKCLNELRSLINQVPNICSFQGLFCEIDQKTVGQIPQTFWRVSRNIQASDDPKFKISPKEHAFVPP